jgi:hypothetical protein
MPWLNPPAKNAHSFVAELPDADPSNFNAFPLQERNRAETAESPAKAALSVNTGQKSSSRIGQKSPAPHASSTFRLATSV